MTGDKLLELDSRAQAGRSGWAMRVKDARHDMRVVRDMIMDTSRSDTPSVLAILRAAASLSRLLHDATRGRAVLKVHIGSGAGEEILSPTIAHSTLVNAQR
jgi:hypothetical protein